jgi:hypothetical protein
MRVFDGEAAVSPGSDAKWVKVKGHHELAFSEINEKPQSFDKDDYAQNDELYNWSKLRSDYLGQANQQLAETYAGQPGFYPGWYWNPGLYAYTWLPGDGLFWSPFGYSFYSPYYIYGGGYIFPHYGVRGIRGGYVHGPYLHGPYRSGYIPRAGHVGHAGGFGGHAAGPHGFSGGHAGGGFHRGGRR